MWNIMIMCPFAIWLCLRAKNLSNLVLAEFRLCGVGQSKATCPLACIGLPMGQSSYILNRLSDFLGLKFCEIV